MRLGLECPMLVVGYGAEQIVRKPEGGINLEIGNSGVAEGESIRARSEQGEPAAARVMLEFLLASEQPFAERLDAEALLNHLSK